MTFDTKKCEEARRLIREKINILDIVLELTGKETVRTVCPFCKGSKLGVNIPHKLFHCFDCKIGGDAYSLLMEFKNIEYGEAIKELAERVGVKYEQRHQITTD